MEKVTALALLCAACGNVEGLRADDLYSLQSRTHTWAYGLTTNGRTGAPLAGVTVLLGGSSTVSEGNGTFRVDGLSEGEVSGSASVHGFQTTSLVFKLESGGNLRDVELEPNECGRYECRSDEFCSNSMCVSGATLSGAVLSACDETSLDALVRIAGKAKCSEVRKGSYFEMNGLTPGPQTISIGKTGYLPYVGQITLSAGPNVFPVVHLTPEGGCSAIPAPAACVCTAANCQY